MGNAPRHARPRIATAAIAVVVLLCHAVAWVHAAATPHVTCLEHGESVHLAAGARLAAPATALRSDRGALTVVANALAESVAHGHEHCGLVSHRPTSVTTPPTVTAQVQTEPAPAPPPAPAERATAQLLRLAPKTSPPGTPTV